MTEKEILKIFTGTCWNILSGKMFILSTFYLVCIIAMTIKLFIKCGIMLTDKEWLKETRTDEFVYVCLYLYVGASLMVCFGLITNKKYCQLFLESDYWSIHGVDFYEVLERIDNDYSNR